MYIYIYTIHTILADQIETVAAAGQLLERRSHCATTFQYADGGTHCCDLHYGYQCTYQSSFRSTTDSNEFVQHCSSHISGDCSGSCKYSFGFAESDFRPTYNWQHLHKESWNVSGASL